jgi:Co/Zn/Cd efflux system component
LLADLGHNLSDVAGLVLAWGGALAGKLKPNVRHTYGWKRGSILPALANALLLLVAVGALARGAIGRILSHVPLVGNEGITIMVVSYKFISGFVTALDTLTVLAHHDFAIFLGERSLLRVGQDVQHQL